MIKRFRFQLLGLSLLLGIFVLKPLLWAEAAKTESSPKTSETSKDSAAEEEEALDAAFQSFSMPQTGSAPSAPMMMAELQGIGISDRAKMAVINEEIYREGDNRNGVQVLQITKKTVDIKMNGKKIALRR